MVCNNISPLIGSHSTTALTSVSQLFLWIVLWLCLTAKRRWAFKLPPLSMATAMVGGSPNGQAAAVATKHKMNGISGPASEPLLPRSPPQSMMASPLQQNLQNSHADGGEEQIYWPKLQPSSPKLKVTFNEVPSMSPTDPIYSTSPAVSRAGNGGGGGEHEGKRG